MKEPRLYSIRIIDTFLEYLRNERPDVDIQDLLKNARIASYEAEDEGHWLTQRQVDDFHEALMKQTGDPTIFREAGRYMAFAKSTRVIRQFVLGFLTPVQAYGMLAKVASYLNRGVTFHTRKLRRNSVEIVIKPREGVQIKPYQCENFKGAFETVARLFTNELPLLEHPACLHRSENCCRYIISWEEPAFLKWRPTRAYTAGFLLVILLICGFVLPPVFFLMAALLTGAGVSGLFHYDQYLEKKAVRTIMDVQGNTANRLLDEIHISYNNALLIQEIGQAVSSVLDIDALVNLVMETLQKRLDFDRGMIMLANPDRTKLVYVDGYGYDPEWKAMLKGTEFRLDNPRSKGPFVIAFNQQKPFLINDIKDFQEDISARSLDLAQNLGVNAFICVPIVSKGVSEGILAVDHYQSKRPLNQRELSLLMGIAPQVGISITNARALGRIRESEERFRTLSENSPDIIFRTDRCGVVSYINPAVVEILGYADHDVVGRYFTDFMKEEEVAPYRQRFQSVMEGGGPMKNFELKLSRHDGAPRLFIMSGAPNFNAVNEMTGMVGILRDMTEQRELEQQLHQASKMNAIGTLTGGIAHDFNNILQAIVSYNQLLMLHKTESDADWKYLNKMKGLTSRATDLINRLLLFSSKMESFLAPVDVNKEIRQYYKLLLHTLPKTIRLKLDLAEDLRPVKGDAGQLGQIVMNLSVNAKDAMPDGGEFRIRTRNVLFDTPVYRGNTEIREGAYARITMTDTGYGIAPDDLEHIFEPFFTTKDQGKGTGIGLSVVYGIIRNHNGYIFCNSEPGGGTCFDMYLPAMDQPHGVQAPHREAEGGMPAGHETILLVDDENSLLETGEELLSFLGYNVITAETGEKALEWVEREKERISLVILDLMMPGMSGEKCLQGILGIAPAMKVIVASGYAARATAEKIERQGAAAFIKKPYQLDDLSKIIREVLAGKG
ncbi:MAG: PAS domain S-box protein [Deltaproteobacteria bacterium]|nr:PAS domain S-box protein [Deltaproteobacteria bacterium]